MPFPTKSGIYGLLLSSLGARGKQKELLEKLADMNQMVISYNLTKTIKKEDEEISVVVPRQPRLMDFQMVGSGYDEKHSWQRMLIPKKSDGSAAVGGGTKMTYRYYLQDARFAVIQEIPLESMQDISDALQHPVYDQFFGRKNCIPTDYVYRGIYDTQQEASDRAERIAEEKGLKAEFRVVEGEYEGENLTIHDVPIEFGEWKKYRDRIVTIIEM